MVGSLPLGWGTWIWGLEGLDPSGLACWALGFHCVVTTREKSHSGPLLSLCFSQCLCLTLITHFSLQRPLHAPTSGLDPRPLSPGLALLSRGAGGDGALTCNEETCRGNDVPTNAAPLAPGSTGALAWAFLQRPECRRWRRARRPQSAPQRRPRREYNNSLAAPAGVEPEICRVRVSKGGGGWRR